ncbi:hypothetical protein ACP70R_019893 [Stipagrostis hirtigluma subsp. patula]
MYIVEERLLKKDRTTVAKTFRKPKLVQAISRLAVGELLFRMTHWMVDQILEYASKNGGQKSIHKRMLVARDYDDPWVEFSSRICL